MAILSQSAATNFIKNNMASILNSVRVLIFSSGVILKLCDLVAQFVR